MVPTFCRVDECVGVAKKAGLCWTHLKRQQRGGDLKAPRRARLGSWDAVVDAMYRYQSAEDDAEYARARAALQRTMKAWVRRASCAFCPPGM